MFTKQVLSIKKSFCHTSEAPSIQALALAATKSGASRPDVQELAKLGNYGNSPQHIYEQMVSKYCKSEAIHMPEPYVVAVQWRPVALFLPHEWFGWISSSNLSEDQREQLAGWSHLGQFWEEHDLLDPKLENNPVMDDGNDPANFLYVSYVHAMFFYCLQEVPVLLLLLVVAQYMGQALHKGQALNKGKAAQVNQKKKARRKRKRRMMKKKWRR